MSKLSHAAAILVLSSAWTLATASAPPAGENPAGSTPSTQQSDKSQTAIEGCISGSVDSFIVSGSVNSFILTDANGKRYELSGDPNQLVNRVGHKVRVQGRTDNVVEAESITAGQPHAAFEVQEVYSLSGACK